MFMLYNKSKIPNRIKNLKKYKNVLKSLIAGCKLLQKNKCKFIVMPCNTAHYWHKKDIQKNIKIPILSMPKKFFYIQKRLVKIILKLEYFVLRQHLKQRFIINTLIKILV